MSCGGDELLLPPERASGESNLAVALPWQSSCMPRRLKRRPRIAEPFPEGDA